MHYQNNSHLLKKGFNYFLRALPWAITFILVTFSAYLYLKKTASFRFFDEENNIVAGYLMTQGRHLYNDIFMNHNPGAPVMSYVLQSFFQTTTLFDLVKLHRTFMIMLGILANILLLIRFRTKALLFVGVYEYLRFYVSGQMFLSESMVAYIFAYYVLLLSEKYLDQKKKITSSVELITASLFFVFVCISREPYVPTVLIFYVLVLFKFAKPKLSLAFFALSIVTIAIFMLQYNITKFYEQVVMLNRLFSIEESKAGGGTQLFSGIFQIVGYPLAAISFDKPLYIILGLASMLFLFFTFRTVKNLKSTFERSIALITIVLLLLFAGLRNFPVGVEWFGMYRSIPYIVIILSFVSSRIYRGHIAPFLIFIIILAFIHPRSHFTEKRINADEYYINYSTSTTDGAVLESLCKKVRNCTLHIDDIHVYPYFVSKIKPSSEYAFYYPVQRIFLDYKRLREADLCKNPPTLYYDSSCTVDRIGLPKKIQDKYVWLIKDDGKKISQSCIAINRKALDTITPEQKEFIGKHFYKLPENKN